MTNHPRQPSDCSPAWDEAVGSFRQSKLRDLRSDSNVTAQGQRYAITDYFARDDRDGWLAQPLQPCKHSAPCIANLSGQARIALRPEREITTGTKYALYPAGNDHCPDRLIVFDLIGRRHQFLQRNLIECIDGWSLQRHDCNRPGVLDLNELEHGELFSIKHCWIEKATPQAFHSAH